MEEGIPIRIARFAVAAAVISTFAAAGIWSIAMALADYRSRQETLPGIQAALRLEIDSAGYYARLAAMLQDRNPAGSTQALQRAVTLNPWDSESRVELGLRAEASGGLASAENSLLRAANVDRQYFPKWSLMNYYFRRGDSEKFWRWAREAAGMAYGDLTPLFSLCWKFTSDGALIEQKLDVRKADLAASYLAYLTSQNRMEPMTRAATRLLTWNREADTPVLLAACNRLIANDRAGQAIGIWNQLADRHSIHSGHLAPSSGISLTDGEFTMQPTSQGFDWRLPNTIGVTTILEGRPAGLRVSFSGRQPENCDALSQVLPIVESSNYEFRFRYRTNGIAPQSGLVWRITDLAGAKLLANGSSLASESESEDRLRFATPGGSGLVRLTLAYHRALGTTRIEGFVSVRNMHLTLLQ